MLNIFEVTSPTPGSLRFAQMLAHLEETPIGTLGMI
jgi:hypothetical protein